MDAIDARSSSEFPDDLSRLAYHCPCLNVQLYRTESGINGQSTVDRDEDALNQNYSGDEQFFKGAIPIKDTLFVSKKVECLCCSRKVSDQWLINVCLNCRIDTHAVRLSNKRDDQRPNIYVSSKMNVDVNRAWAMIRSDDYSRVYNIVVRPLIADEGSIGFGRSLDAIIEDDCDADNRSQELKRTAITFLDQERVSMTTRIDEYKKEQLCYFKELESRVQQDKNILMHAIQAGGGQKSNSTVFQVTMEVQTDRPVAKPLPQVVETPVGRNKNKTTSAFDVFEMDDDDVFNPGDDDDDNGVVTSSDEDECPSDDAPPPSASTSSYMNSASQLYASSLPVSMPTTASWKAASFMRSTTSTNRFLEDPDTPSSVDDDFKTDDPEWMAASIKALAMSVRGDDSTDLFGARPRPRLNTLD